MAEEKNNVQWRVPKDNAIVGKTISVPFGKGKPSILFKKEVLIIQPFENPGKKKKPKKSRKEMIRPRYQGKVIEVKGNIVTIKLELTDEKGGTRGNKIIYRKIEDENHSRASVV